MHNVLRSTTMSERHDDESVVLLIGATGMIGRPVTRVLAGGNQRIRVLSRDIRRAAAWLPEGIEFAAGDVQDVPSLQAAMRGVSTVYISLSPPMRGNPPEWNPDREGVFNIITAAKQSGVQRLLRLSAMGVEEAAGDWWAASHKLDSDKAIQDSGIDWTIFRPTWFMESIPAFSAGPHMFIPGGHDQPLYFIAGEDFGHQVDAAIASPEAVNTMYQVQGPEGLSLKEACKRFARIWKAYFLPTPLPGFAIAAGAALGVPQARYMKALFEMTYEYVVKTPQDVNGTELYTPTITVDQFARHLLHSRDFPSKLPVASA